MDTEMNQEQATPTPESNPTPENTTANTTEESAPDYSDDALIASFAADYEKDNPPTEEPSASNDATAATSAPNGAPAAGTSQPEEPTFEVIVNGKKERVTQQELINGYMRQSDYSRKTQELARQREEVNQQQNNLSNKTENSGKKVESSSLQDELTKLTEQKLGLAPGEFNPYDDRHLFTRQQLLLEFNNLKKEQESLRRDVQTFVQQAEQDPLASEIDKNFDTLLYEAASRDPRVRPLVQQVLDAKQALKSGTLNREQANLLAAHWNFTRNYLQQKNSPQQNPQGSTPIPKTINSSQTAPKTYSSKRLRSMSHDDDAQLDYLISQGLIKE